MSNDFWKRRKWLLGIIAGALGTFTAVRAGSAQGTWTALAPVPTPAEGMTVGGVGQVIVGAYGYSPALGNTNQTRLYNVSTNSWSAGATAPLPARAEAAYGDTTHAGFLYVIGGGKSGGGLSDLQRDHPGVAGAVTLTPIPTAPAGAGAARIGHGSFVPAGALS